MIVVTGGASFIGANFVADWLACNGEPVLCVDTLTEPLRKTGYGHYLSSLLLGVAP
ncbi:hypothetical protein B0G81_8216 [Paraburkholderia sp. BL6665CI2N2]|nr:hypothetical protein B0G81_8216 [Paraburkholderia sp. BL6665CI2N2]